MEKEEKSIVLPFSFKAISAPNEKGYVEFEGYAAAFDNVDLGNDVIIKGAFADTIKDGVNWPVLMDHMSYMTETAGFNISAVEDDFGLKIKGQINTNVEAGKIVYHLSKQALELGKTIGLSIGYGIVEKEFDPDSMIRTLKKIKMYEYSFTNFPMNPKASITALKSRQMEMIKSVVIEVLKAENLIQEKKDDEEQAETSEKDFNDILQSITNLKNEVKNHE